MDDVEIIASGYGLIEGPTIDDAGRLCFSDVTNGGVFRLDGGEVEVVVPRRRYVGGICAHAEGGLIVSGRDLSHAGDGHARVVCAPGDLAPAATPFLMFSDICADARGRVFAGVPCGESPEKFADGRLVMVTEPGRATDVVTDVVLPNGIAVSGDGAWLFQSDSETNRIIRYDLEVGDLPQMADSFPTEGCGFPDGLATDVDGGVWAASYRDGCVVRFTPDGKFDRSIAVPAQKVTSVCFGGDDLSDLVVVTADNTDDPSLGGCIFRLPSATSGSPTCAATV